MNSAAEHSIEAVSTANIDEIIIAKGMNPTKRAYNVIVDDEREYTPALYNCFGSAQGTSNNGKK